MSAASISVIVPVYRSAATLRTLVERLHPVLAQAAPDYELILVNDGSPDESWDAICALVEEYRWIRGIDLARNFGQHNALLCGIRAARCELAVTMDDDLQNPPEEIPRLVERLYGGAGVVYGTPRTKAHGPLRNLASAATKIALRNAMGAETARHVSAFRVFRTQLRDAFADYRGPWVSVDVLLTWGTQSFAAVPVNCEPRANGASSYTLGKLAAHALNMITGFSTLPLRVASVVGFVCTLAGMALLGYVLAIYFMYDREVPGFAFLASIVTIFSGAQLFAIGVFGEYLARMHVRLMDRPPYVVRGRAGAEARRSGVLASGNSRARSAR